MINWRKFDSEDIAFEPMTVSIPKDLLEEVVRDVKQVYQFFRDHPLNCKNVEPEAFSRYAQMEDAEMARLRRLLDKLTLFVNGEGTK